MHRVNYYDSIVVQDGLITRLVTAEWRDLTLTVYKEIENKTQLVRNVYLSSVGGYMVAFPGERIGSGYYSYWGDQKEVLQDWRETSRLPLGKYRSLLPEEQEIIINKYPAFKYILKKFPLKTDNLMQILAIWKDHPDVEFLLQAGYSNIALDKRFYKLTEKKRKEICKWLMKNSKTQEVDNPTLTAIQILLKYGIDYQTYIDYCNKCSYNCCTVPYDVYEYICRKFGAKKYGELAPIYKDYKNLCKQAGHRMSDKYWKFPSDLIKAHAKVLAEVNEINRLKEMAVAKDWESKMLPGVKQLEQYNRTVNGYHIFITENMTEWNRQADVLHQCIVRCKYMNGIIDRKYVIVFIQKKNIPVATAQVYSDKKLGQLYADEKAENIYPSNSVKKMVLKWIDNLPDNFLQEEKKSVAETLKAV